MGARVNGLRHTASTGCSHDTEYSCLGVIPADLTAQGSPAAVWSSDLITLLWVERPGVEAVAVNQWCGACAMTPRPEMMVSAGYVTPPRVEAAPVRRWLH
jgi:hypothetical protein